MYDHIKTVFYKQADQHMINPHNEFHAVAGRGSTALPEMRGPWTALFVSDTRICSAIPGSREK